MQPCSYWVGKEPLVVVPGSQALAVTRSVTDGASKGTVATFKTDAVADVGELPIGEQIPGLTETDAISVIYKTQ